MIDTTAIKERPILFSGPMARAVYEGRKTQTRRIIKGVEDFTEVVKVIDPSNGNRPFWRFSLSMDGATQCHNIDFPHGVPGERLWGREGFSVSSEPHEPDGHYWLTYLADGTSLEIDGSEISMGRLKPGKSYPSIHMPRWACRLLLEITDVQAERLNDISGEDAIAEGCTNDFGDPEIALSDFVLLWESINGAGSWNLNPWVEAITFKVITP